MTISNSLGGITVQGIEGGTLVPSLGAADAVVSIDLHHLPSSALCGCPQLGFLVRGVLIGGRDPEIDRSALHDGPPYATREIGGPYRKTKRFRYTEGASKSADFSVAASG